MENRYREATASPTNQKLVAIVVPLSFNLQLSAEEETSLRHLRHYLNEYDKFMVAPVGHAVAYDGFEMKYFDHQYFGSAQAHKKLSFSRTFYETFAEYQFMLMYHLDALVFSNQLQKWCSFDYDYIGAPWVKHVEAPYHGNERYEDKVGNSGFSLRKISSFLEIIDSVLTNQPMTASNPRQPSHQNWFKQGLKNIRSQLNGCTVPQSRQGEMNTYPFNDDTFWANRATHYCPDFKIPSVDVALQFAFECVPRHCFKLSGNQLPFGCHAWARYDRQFWEPYLLTE